MALSECPELRLLESDSLADFKLKSNSWIRDYGTCKIKQEVLLECFQAYEKYYGVKQE